MSGSIGIGTPIKPELEGEVIRTIVKKAKLGKRPRGRMHMELNGESTIWLSCGTRRDFLLSVKIKDLPYQDNSPTLKGCLIVTQQAA